MKEKAQPIAQRQASSPDRHRSAGPRGVALTPPPYGIAFVDQAAGRENRTGLPDRLKAGVENLSGLAMDDVRVHYNSPRPAQLAALAYTQGTEIHVAPGQERHLAHEAWHVVQQKQGRVRATMQMKGVGVNDEPRLEMEADRMGARAIHGGLTAQKGIEPFSAPVCLTPGWPEGGSVQRKVGFEFEDNNWRPWYLGYFSRLYPVPRKAVLHTETGYKLEADDTPGPKASNLEFVTDPFEATTAGLAGLQETLRRIKVVCDRLAGCPKHPNPEYPKDGPPYDYIAGQFVGQDQHQLNGPNYGNGRWVYLSGGDLHWCFKMQATAGASLDDITKVMKYFGVQVPDETAAEQNKRKSARISIAGSENAANKLSYLKILGGSPAIAEDAATRIRSGMSLSDGSIPTAFQPDHCADLLGWLSVVIMTMKSLQLPLEGPVKYRMSLMLRTDFVRLFDALPEAQRNWLQTHTLALITALIDASNAKPLIGRTQGINPDSDLTADSPLIRLRFVSSTASISPTESINRQSITALEGISIGAWIHGFINGVDYLTPSGADAWLKSRGWWWWSRPQPLQVLESFGTVGRMDTSSGAPERLLAVFENRVIAPTIGVGLTFEQASRQAWNQLLFYKRIEDSRASHIAIGAYPDEDVGNGS